MARSRHTDMAVTLLWFLMLCASSKMTRCHAMRRSMGVRAMPSSALLTSDTGFSMASLDFISSVTPTSLLMIL